MDEETSPAAAAAVAPLGQTGDDPLVGQDAREAELT